MATLNVFVRPATLADMQGLLAMAERFVQESGYGWHFYNKAAELRFKEFIEAAWMDVLVAELEGQLVGLSMLVWDRDFIAEAVGYVSKFYVSPEGRGKGVGRALVQASLEWAKAHQCKHLFASATGNISGESDRMFENLFKKYDFKVQGVCLAKEVSE